MNSNIVTAINTKENTLEFNLTVQGLDANDVSVRLIVETEKIEFGFPCNKKDDSDVWTVTLPVLNMLEKTAYPFKLTVIADGYYFEPHKGTLNVVGSQEIYSSAPKNVSVKPKENSDTDNDKKDDDKKDDDKKEKSDKVKESIKYTKQREKPIEQIAKELMESTLFKKSSNTHTMESTTKKVKEDDKVDNVLKNLGINVSNKKPNKFKFNLKD